MILIACSIPSANLAKIKEAIGIGRSSIQEQENHRDKIPEA